MLKPVTIKKISPNESPKYVKTQFITAERDGKEFGWEMIKSHNSVHIIVNNVDKKEIMFVKQVRIPVLVNNPGTNGQVYEACAGLVDKDIPIENIAQEEILEELGYQISIENIDFIKKLKSGVGKSGNDSYAFYAEVKESDKLSDGGGLHDEDIEVVTISYDQIESMMFSEEFTTDAMTMFLTMWVLKYKL